MSSNALWLLWPISGWLCGYFSTPKWMFVTDWFGYIIMGVCGAVVGPLGAIWFLFP